MSEFKIYHNPRCSKSRQALAILEEKGVEVEQILYLESRQSRADLQILLQRLKKSPREILRTGEDIYKELNLADPDLSDKAIIDAILAHPKLMERPIVVRGSKAVIGRPPENILELF